MVINEVELVLDAEVQVDMKVMEIEVQEEVEVEVLTSYLGRSRELRAVCHSVTGLVEYRSVTTCTTLSTHGKAAHELRGFPMFK